MRRRFFLARGGPQDVPLRHCLLSPPIFPILTAGVSLPTFLPSRYRFAEIRYHRAEEVHRGRVVPSRVETVVLFLPDAWRCQPSRLDWDRLQSAFTQQLRAKLHRSDDPAAAAKEDDSQALLLISLIIIIIIITIILAILFSPERLLSEAAAGVG